MAVYQVTLSGFKEITELVSGLKNNTATAALRSINTTARRARAAASLAIRQQVNFSASYLSQDQGRLKIAAPATANNLQSTIVGRFRPTSLARFALDRDSKTTFKRGGTRVEVKPGAVKFLKNTFLIRLRQGNLLTDTNFNLGLALRLKPGETVRNKRTMVRFAKNLYLLYGPSVDQVFRTVAENMQGDNAEFLEQEFLRVLGVLNGRR